MTLPLGRVPQIKLRDNPREDEAWKRWFLELRSVFSPSGTLDHDSLAGLQGGAADEYYHLTAAQFSLAEDAFTTQTANTLYAGPTTGAAANPTFRVLVAADIPAAARGNLYYSAVHG